LLRESNPGRNLLGIVLDTFIDDRVVEESGVFWLRFLFNPVDHGNPVQKLKNRQDKQDMQDGFGQAIFSSNLPQIDFAQGINPQGEVNECHHPVE